MGEEVLMRTVCTFSAQSESIGTAQVFFRLLDVDTQIQKTGYIKQLHVYVYIYIYVYRHVYVKMLTNIKSQFCILLDLSMDNLLPDKAE